MIGELPARIIHFRSDGSTEAAAPSAPAASEVLVAAAGYALGVEPAAELAGTVVATGEAAAHWLGQRVVVPRVLPCGECDRCRRGRVATCAARVERRDLVSHQRLPARYLCAVEPPLWPEGHELWQLAALADAAATPHAALMRAGIGPGDPVLVLGDGPRAAFARALAAAAGAVLVADDGGALAGVTVLEASGEAAARAGALGRLGPGGVAVWLDGSRPSTSPSAPGRPDGAAGADAAAGDAFVAAEAQLMGVAAAHPDLLPELCALVVRGRLPLAPHVEPVTPAGLAAAWAARGTGTRLPVLVLPA